MLKKLAQLSQSISVSHPMIDQWLESRRKLLVAYYHFAGLTETKQLDEFALDKFCQRLVDYLSYWHFRNYQQLLELFTDQHQPAQNQAIFREIDDNTHQLMQVYDEYLEPAIADREMSELRAVISQLAETMETRFDLEDRLLLTTDLSVLTADHPANSPVT